MKGIRRVSRLVRCESRIVIAARIGAASEIGVYQHRLGMMIQVLDLAREFRRPPEIVGVEKCDQLASGHQDAAIARHRGATRLLANVTNSIAERS